MAPVSAKVAGRSNGNSSKINPNWNQVSFPVILTSTSVQSSPVVKQYRGNLDLFPADWWAGLFDRWFSRTWPEIFFNWKIKEPGTTSLLMQKAQRIRWIQLASWAKAFDISCVGRRNSSVLRSSRRSSANRTRTKRWIERFWILK